MVVENSRRPRPQPHPDPQAAEPPDALIEEARRWQRRRRWYRGGIAALLIVAGLVAYGSLSRGTSHAPATAAGTQGAGVLQRLSVVSVTAVKPYSPLYFAMTELPRGKTVRSASVAGFEITVRNGTTSPLSHVRVTLVVDRPHFPPLVKTETLPAIGARGTATVLFPRFVGAEFTEKTNVEIALGSEPGKVYPLSVPWA